MANKSKGGSRQRATSSAGAGSAKGGAVIPFVREGQCLLTAALATFAFFAILTALDWNSLTSELPPSSLKSLLIPPSENMMGPVGGWLAGALVELFGVSSMLLPLWFAVSSIQLLLHLAIQGGGEDAGRSRATLQTVLQRPILFGTLLLLTSSLATVRMNGLGGIVGDLFGGALRSAFGASGALLILGTVLVFVAYLLFAPLLMSVLRLLVSVLSGAASAFPLLFERVSAVLKVTAYFAVSLLGMLLFAMVRAVSFLGRGGRALLSFGRRAAASLTAAVMHLLEHRRELKRLELARSEQELLLERERRELLTSKDNGSQMGKARASAELVLDESKIVVVDHSRPKEFREEEFSDELNDDEATPERSIHSRMNGETSQFADDESEDPFADYEFPPTDLLQAAKASKTRVSKEELLERSRIIQSKLLDFQVAGQITHVHPGPVITMYEFEPAPGIKVGKITSLQDDLAMALRAPSIRIIAPLPERGSVGIEVPNESQEVVYLRELLEYGFRPEDTARLPIPLGKDTFGAPVTGYIADMPHLLLAGATGTGKSVCINAILISLLYRLHPAELQLIMIDPKILELSIYEGVPHLKVPVVTDPRKAKAVLQWAAIEMDNRYRTLKQYGVRNIDAYNDLVSGRTPPDLLSTQSSDDRVIVQSLVPLPKILIVIDELADLMLTSGREVEELITRLAQKARAAGIHLLLATQRPSVDVITGLIKANFPARVSFRVSSRIDSRTILDTMGAERLLGKGDMLFLRPGAHHLQRVHGAFVSDQEVRKVTAFLRETCPPAYDEKVMEMCEKALEDQGASLEPGGDSATSDPLYDQAVQFVLERGQASTSMIQRAFRIGYNRAARMVDTMEQEGLVGPMDGAKPRQVIVPHSAQGE